MTKPTLILDFDGVLHSYETGWHGADVVADGPVPGAQEFCVDALEKFQVVIVSTRCSQPGGPQAIVNWLAEHEFPLGIHVSEDGTKPLALVTIDDRAITFKGKWPYVEGLLRFKPWNRK